MTSLEHITAARRVARIFDRASAALRPLAPGARLVLGCSAGGDSMALLDLAAREAPKRNWALAVAHLDHAQRPESAQEARQVGERARALGLEFFSERLEAVGTDHALRLGLSEDAMRQARHVFFRRAAKAWNAVAIVLAHQADDQAETFLIRLLTGSGPTGLAAIRPVERVAGLTIVRPLLEARREDLRDYLRHRRLSWRDDPSNDSGEAKRSWVRGALLPLIRERTGEDAAGAIARAAGLIREEAEVLEETVGLVLRALALEPPEGALARLDLTNALWREAGPLARRQLMRQWLWELRRGAHPPGYEAVREALAFVESARPGAELRTVERMHVVHCKKSLVAFAPEVDEQERKAAVVGLLPKREPNKRTR